MAAKKVAKKKTTKKAKKSARKPVKKATKKAVKKSLIPNKASSDIIESKVLAAKTTKNVKFAGFWIRFLAFIIDGIILGAIGGLVNSGSTSFNPITGGASLGVAWLYFALLQSSAWQGSVGKKVLNLKVVDRKGNRITFLRATGRFFAKILSTIILLIGFIMVAFTKRKQGLHDLIAETLVIKA